VDELNDLGIEFVSARENIDTSGAMGRMFVTIIGCIAEGEMVAIHAGCFHAQADFARPGLLGRCIFNPEVLRTAEGMQANNPWHSFSSPGS
jgi:DNA invertase Pin-like site-specific DNA recombinase